MVLRVFLGNCEDHEADTTIDWGRDTNDFVGMGNDYGSRQVGNFQWDS